MRRVWSNMSLDGALGSVMIQLLVMATLVDMRSHGFAIRRQPDALVDTGQHLVTKEIALTHVPTMRYSTPVKEHAVSTNNNNHYGKAFENNRQRTYGSSRLHRNIHTSKLERLKKVTVLIPRSRLETVADNLLMESQSRDTVMIIENKPKLSTLSPKQETAISTPEQKTTEYNKITGQDNSSSYSTQPVNLTEYTSAFTPTTLESQNNTKAQFNETNNKLNFETIILEKEIIDKEYTKKPAETKIHETELIGTQSSNTSMLITPTLHDSTILTTPLFGKASGERLQNTETFTEEVNSVSIVPSWKKYSVIDRKPVTKALDADVVISQQEMVTTKYSGVEFSNVSNDTKNFYESSLESELKPDYRRRHKKDEKYETRPQISSVAETTELTSTKIETEMAEVLSSKRGGYLNHSVKQYDAVKTVEDDDTLDYDAPIPKKKLDATDIQNKMIEDAILSEEKINDEENARLFRASFASSEDTSSTMLSVKPIVNISKNTTLYTVNPNYKPLKKLEVQPPKSYVRDPDDNSWRNESISSLGIVFKPKNSSKPLTQVLKDKTESEISNLTEKKENTSELPELRERLEKLTEMRKIKKKKPLSNEELSDSDYKDFNIDWFLKDLASTTTIKPFVEEYVYSNTEDKLPTQKLKQKKIFEYYENTMTTVKPVENKKKKTNAAMDYYDNLYDHDDFTLQDIDLKRYPVTKPSVIMQVKTMSTTTKAPKQKKQKIERERKPQKNLQAERRPTLQYFPPRIAQKIMDSEFYPKYEDQFSFVGETEPAFPPNTIPEVTTIKTTTQTPKNNKLYYTTQTTPKVEPYVDQRDNYIVQAGRLFDELQRFSLLSPNTSPPGQSPEPRATMKPGEAEDYAEQFHQGGEQIHQGIEKFIQNFQENTERFKVDYPVVYNHSVVHKADSEGNKVVSSVAFMRQIFDDDASIEPPSTKRPLRHQKHFLDQIKAYDPEQEKTVELSPDYELHYYIPEEEQSESITVPYN